MAVVHLVRRCPRTPDEIQAADDLCIRSVWSDRDGPLISRLAAELAPDLPTGAGGPPQAIPAAGGLLGELASRPDRRVEAWLAVVPGGGPERPLGLVSLVGCRPQAAATPRYSLGWLLVHPQARRRGIGRALVSHACRQAWARGAEAVWIESRSDWAGAVAFWEAVGFSRPADPAAPGLAPGRHREP